MEVASMLDRSIVGKAMLGNGSSAIMTASCADS
jgi:hypothetical protein